jgi:hypothetical protein
MQDLNKSKSKTLTFRKLGLTMAVTLAAAGLAAADHEEDYYSRTETSGHVEIVKSIPGGIITVGATIGQPRPQVVREREVVIVERPEPRRVVVVREERPREVVVIHEHKHGRHHKHNKHYKHGRKVIVEKHIIRDSHCDNRRGDRDVERVVYRGDRKGHDHYNHGNPVVRRVYARN